MKIRRRRFLLSLAGTAAAGLSGCSLNPRTALSKVTRSGYALGTDTLLTVFHADRKQAEAALEAAFTELNRVEEVMSLFRPQSEICRLNATGRLANPSKDLLNVLEAARALSVKSEGAFDITVQPLWKLYSERAEKGGPDAVELKEALQHVNWQGVRANERTVTLDRGMTITLNGIAQGYAADRVAVVLREHGIEHGLIDTGEIGVIGTHPQKDHWKIGIKHPRDPAKLLDLAALRGRCLATSGDYESTFDAEFRNHHLIDPRSGRSPDGLSSASVVALTAMDADALSTAAFLMGEKAGRALIEATPGADGLFVTKAGKTVSTPGFPSVA